MSTEVIIRNLGTIVGSTVKFSEPANAFLTQGYTSLANNTYFCAVRFAEGIIIQDQVAQGHSRTFLNGLRIYSMKDKTLLADRSYHSVFYSKDKVYNEAKDMLMKLMQEASGSKGYTFDKQEAEQTISRIIKESVYGDQMVLAQSQIRKALSA